MIKAMKLSLLQKYLTKHFFRAKKNPKHLKRFGFVSYFILLRLVIKL